jgi:hypothetical protein
MFIEYFKWIGLFFFLDFIRGFNRPFFFLNSGCRWFPRRLLTAFGVSPSLDVGNFPTCFQLAANLADRLMVGLHLFCDRTI